MAHTVSDPIPITDHTTEPLARPEHTHKVTHALHGEAAFFRSLQAATAYVAEWRKRNGQ
jgi:hypothetical protein